MAVKRMFSYEELNDMTGEELLDAYNTMARRINRRIDRAGGTKATGQKHIKVIRSNKARAEFLKEYKKARVRTTREVYKLAKSANAPTAKQVRDEYRRERRKALKIFVRQSFAGSKLAGDYNATWVDKLTNREFDKLLAPLDKYGLGDINNNYEFLYYYYMAWISGNDMIAVQSKEDMEFAIDVAVQSFEEVEKRYSGLSKEERAKKVARDIRRGRTKVNKRKKRKTKRGGVR